MRWSAQWKGAQEQKKQRKYRANAPLHARQKFLHAPLTADLREKVQTKRLGVKAGDRVEIMRGEYAGMSGSVEVIDRTAVALYIDGITRQKVDGSEVRVPFHPSQVRITRLQTDDDRRLGFTIEQPGEDEADEDTIETSAESDKESVETSVAEETDSVLSDETRQVIQTGTVAEVREKVQHLDKNGLEEALSLEKANKNRKGVNAFIEQQLQNAGDQ